MRVHPAKLVSTLLAVSLLAVAPLPDASAARTGPLSAAAGAGNTASGEAGPFFPDDGVLPVQTGADDKTDPVFLIRYEEAAQNNRMVLYADMDKGLFAVKNKETGKIWYSTPRDSLADPKTKGKLKQNMQSQLLVTFIYREDENTNIALQVANSQVSCINRGKTTVTPVTGGIRVLYEFADIGIRIPVEYTLREDYISARVDLEQVDEGDQCLLVSIHLLPTMGAGSWEEKGYMLVPDGSGAIVNFNNNVNLLEYYERPVYGRDHGIVSNTLPPRAEDIRLPVFGIVNGGDALMGVISQGDASAAIAVYNGNDSTGYNAVSSKAVLRSHTVIDSFYVTNHKTSILQISHTPSGQKAYEVRYYPLSGDKASYAGMAGAYRGYLEENGLTKNPQKPSLTVNFVGAADLKANFLGVVYDKLEPLTPFSRAQDILKDLQARGVGALTARYSGWSNAGLLNIKAPGKAAPLAALGGSKAFSVLSDYCQSEGVPLYPAVDFIRFRKGGNGVSGIFDCAKTPAGNDALQYEYMPSVHETKLHESPVRLLKPAKLFDVAEPYLASYKKLGLDTLALDSLGLLYSDFRESGGVHRSDLPDYFREVLEAYRKEGIRFAFSAANAYLLPYALKIDEAPIYSSGYDIFDRDVPFYQMVLHGYVSMTVPAIVQSVEPEAAFLKAVETGSGLYYTCTDLPGGVLSDSRYAKLYGTTYSLWAAEAAEQYRACGDFLARVYDKAIVSHEKAGPGVYKTVFEGGAAVLVNYGGEDAAYEGRVVKSMGFLELEVG